MTDFFTLFMLEARTILRDRSILLTMFGGIILYSIIYPLPYMNQVSRDIDVVVIDFDRSSLSRELIRMVDASPDIEVIGQVTSINHAETMIKTKAVKGLLVIPKHFRRDVIMKNPVTLSLGGDASYFMTYSTIASGIIKAGGTLSAKIKIARLTIDSENVQLAQQQWRPAVLNSQPVFNPANGYLDYVVPAVLILILQQTLLIVSGILSGSQNEQARLTGKGYWLTASPVQLLFIRSVIFLGLYLVFCIYYFGFVLEAYGISHLASALNILRILVPFILAVLCLGLALGQFYRQAETATQVVLFSSMPLIFSSGFIWPVAEIPSYILAISQIFPSTAAIQGLLQLNQMGADFALVAHFQTQLVWQACGYATITILIMSYRQYRRKKKQRLA